MKYYAEITDLNGDEYKSIKIGNRTPDSFKEANEMFRTIIKYEGMIELDNGQYLNTDFIKMYMICGEET